MYNRLIVAGNLTRDIELRYLPSGAAVAKSAIATSFKYKSGTGEQKDEVCFLDFNVFGKSAEILNQYVRKGSKVLLEGRLVFEQWTAQDGSNRSRHSLRVESFKFLDSKSESTQQSQQPQQQNQAYQVQHQDTNGNVQQSYAEQNNQQQQHNQNMAIPEYDIDESEIPF